MERRIYNEKDNNEIWFKNAEVQAAMLTRSLSKHFSQSYELIQQKRAERAERAAEFRYPDIRKPDNHRTRYRRHRKLLHDYEKKGLKPNWMFV